MKLPKFGGVGSDSTNVLSNQYDVGALKFRCNVKAKPGVILSLSTIWDLTTHSQSGNVALEFKNAPSNITLVEKLNSDSLFTQKVCMKNVLTGTDFMVEGTYLKGFGDYGAKLTVDHSSPHMRLAASATYPNFRKTKVSGVFSLSPNVIAGVEFTHCPTSGKSYQKNICVGYHHSDFQAAFFTSGPGPHAQFHVQSSKNLQVGIAARSLAQGRLSALEIGFQHTLGHKCHWKAKHSSTGSVAFSYTWPVGQQMVMTAVAATNVLMPFPSAVRVGLTAVLTS